MPERMENKLREFKDTDDLFDSASSETILRWVNQLAKQVDYRKDHQKVYQKKRRLLMKAAEELLAPDEKRRILEMATNEVIYGQGEQEDPEEA